MKLTCYDYVKTSGAICPFCESNDLSPIGGVSLDYRLGEQTIECLSCKTRYKDNYILKSFNIDDEDTANTSTEDYLRLGGCICPFCKSRDLFTKGSPELQESGVEQNVGCEACGKEWTEEYALTGFTEE